MKREIMLGLEACVAERPPALRSARIGLLMNRASVDRNLRLACDVLHDAYPGQIAALFTPQHGLWGDAQANMIETDHGWHAGLDVPIYSLYSASRRPSPEMLAGLDCFVIDLQDVGTRVYTFVWTMLECLHACAEANVAVLVLDRPNPIGGRIIEGPLLEDAYRSFVGGAPVPMRHGLTMGELALLLKSELQIDVSLEIVPVQRWSPEDLFAALGRHWLLPSPNLPTAQSAIIYPGQVLLEGTNLSEGRGTTTPFEVVGAPFIDPDTMIQALGDIDLPGVHFLPLYFRPTFDKWRDQLCGGVSIHITDAERFRSLKTSIAILSVIQQHWPNDFRWLDPPYEYETRKPPIDIIYGSNKLREGLGSGQTVDGLTEVDVTAWNQRTFEFQIYDPSEQRFRG
ncbi:hypothetical protein Pla52o_49940 [Novipirellula galeiformis]|uniref:DUF1343 domain-containing protein n=1 Tax=Novipirellula galeiformis TaxID=2528004 RepID=A0A5C6C4P5_9BACT|nr:DUF1343 domain-containing protein [Novipirellula galeiformis]TWU17779.1 hypothetical protein Pla52o_49940 [Novipirellula galeiformis]